MHGEGKNKGLYYPNTTQSVTLQLNEILNLVSKIVNEKYASSN